jgi:signal transduction histidine kinase/two-component SAPR family response regulator
MGKILLADDNQDNRLGVARVLQQSSGHAVEQVADGAAALLRLDAGDIDLVLLEVKLPIVDGFEVCRRVRANPRTQQIPVVFLTATQYHMESRLKGLEVGADDFIAQPVSEAELVARVKAALRVKALSDEVRRHNVELESNVLERTRTAEQLADQLRAERDTLRETYDVFDQPLLLVEVSGQVLVANAAARTLKQSALSAELDTLVADASRSRSICDRSLTHAGRSFVARAYPVTKGRVLLYVRDVTEERSYEVRRLQAEKLASIGTLAAGVAHEINNPAAFVLGNLEALSSHVREIDDHLTAADDPALRNNLAELLFEVKAVLQETKEGMARIHRIVRDLSSFSHVDDDRGATSELGATVESTLSLLRNELRHRTRLERDLRSTRVVAVSQARLGQVFLNLILNAAQALDEARAAHNRIVVRTYDRGDDSFFEVTDNGPGIPPDVLPRIFDSFFTTKPRGVGTGLGLPIVQGIVRSLDGEIAVETRVGRGTTFRVRLPSRSPARAEAAPTPTEPAGGAPERSSRRRRILAVDDEPLLLKAYRRMLADVHEVVTALGGRDALLVLQKDPGFDVILCDLQMPEMSGMELHAKVKARHPALAERFVFATGGAFSLEAKRFLEQGITCIGKPFRVEELTAAIEAKLAAQTGAPGPGPADETTPVRSEDLSGPEGNPQVEVARAGGAAGGGGEGANKDGRLTISASGSDPDDDEGGPRVGIT